MSDWTISTLREHLQEQIKHVAKLVEINEARAVERQQASEKAVVTALSSAKELVLTAQTAADRAVQKAETASEKRFEGVNEFRGAMEDLQGTFMPRAEAQILIDAMAKKLDEVTRAVSATRNVKSGVVEGWGWAVGVLGLMALVITAVIALRNVAQ